MTPKNHAFTAVSANPSPTTDCTLLNRRLYPIKSSAVPYLITAFAIFFTALISHAQDQPKKKKPQPVPEGVEVIRDIEYANVDGHSLTLDVYRPFDWADLDHTPVVIWVHGGGWKNGSKDRCPAVYLAQDNLSVISINYRLIGSGQWPDQINDCYAAVRWVRENAQDFGFGEKIGVWGSSAGGHLVALMGTRAFDGDESTSSKVQAVCDFFGPADLLTMPPNMIANGRTRADVDKSNGALLLGKTVMDVPDLAHDASALHQVSEGDAPFLIMHGSADPGVPLDQSQRLHDKLQAAGVESELVILQGAKHGGPEFKTPETQEKVKSFFKKHLF